MDISQRPAIVEKRSRTGDFEGDTIYGQDAYLVTLVDRKSRLLLMAKTPDKTAEVVVNTVNTLLNRVAKVHTLTLDKWFSSPKGTAFGSLTEQKISDMELRLNMTPRKVLNGLTPMEVYTGRMLHLLR